MALLYAATVQELESTRAPNNNYAEIAQTHVSAVSWSAVAAGPVDATALALILLLLGVGLELSSVSPSAHYGASAATVGVSAILWVTLKQVLASALGAIWPAGCKHAGMQQIQTRQKDLVHHTGRPWSAQHKESV